MSLSERAQAIHTEIANTTRRGDIKRVAKEVKQDHDLAWELWSTGDYNCRLLAVLILDKRRLTQDSIELLAQDMAQHVEGQRDTLVDWFMANQLMKSKRTTDLVLSWQEHPLPLLRRIFWYYQARLRWTGKVPIDNGEALLRDIDQTIEREEPEVQWAMNYLAGQIGIHEDRFRDQCIELGKRTGLFKDDPVSPGCTPNYLPAFIEIELAKM